MEKVLGKRMERFGLTLHPEKTRLIAFERPKARERDGKGPGTFDFLGFTMYWRRTRHGRWEMWCKTRGESLRRFNVQLSRRRMVSAPPASCGAGSARSAQETLGRTLQLLRSERQRPEHDAGTACHDPGMVQMAAPSQSAYASHVGAVCPIVGTLPASPAASSCADMGRIATRHISGGAGWCMWRT